MTDLRSEIEIYDGTAELAKDIGYVHTLHAKYFGPARPFYWPAETGCAPSGQSQVWFISEKAFYERRESKQ